MPYDIVLADEAIEDLRLLPSHLRPEVKQGMERHLRHAPTSASRSRIKRLKGITHPQFRLRIGGMRIFYDVEGKKVEVLAIVSKSKAKEWLERVGR
jgi:mRNA-degrading endonuclease RelE of RelBE toxin-antitoxin system